MLVSLLSAFLPSAGTKGEHCHFRSYVASEDLNSGLHSRIRSILPTEPTPLLLMQSSLTSLPSQSTVDLNYKYCLHLEVDDTKIQSGVEGPEESLVPAATVSRIKACTQRHYLTCKRDFPHMIEGKSLRWRMIWNFPWGLCKHRDPCGKR